MNEIVRTYRGIRQDYRFNPSIMNDDDERVARVKEIIQKKLTTVDRTIILLYADCQSYRKLGSMLGLSHMTVRKECLRIRKKILEEYEHIR